jgi:DNA-directed RNA polymerase specialized sigma subunit
MKRKILDIVKKTDKTPREIARSVGVSEQYVYKLLKDNGITFKKYIRYFFKNNC